MDELTAVSSGCCGGFCAPENQASPKPLPETLNSLQTPNGSGAVIQMPASRLSALTTHWLRLIESESKLTESLRRLRRLRREIERERRAILGGEP